MTKAHRQEALSRAYVQAVAACAGLSISEPKPDYGIDMTLREIDIRGGRMIDEGPHIDVQVKCTVQADPTGSDIVFDLDAGAYEVLRRPTARNVRILVLVVVPGDERRWITQSVRGLTIHRCAYWLSLQGAPPSSNRRSVRVRILRDNVFSVAALRELVARSVRGDLR